jgi:hypothetical protein
MTQMRYVGFFSEQEAFSRLDTPRPSIREELLAGANYPSSSILGYLESGHRILDMMGRDPDLLDDEVSIPGGASLLTDGSWVWREDLIYHVRRYTLHLPWDFVETARRNHYKCPPIAIEELRSIAELVCREVGMRADGGTGPRRS